MPNANEPAPNLWGRERIRRERSARRCPPTHTPRTEGPRPQQAPQPGALVLEGAPARSDCETSGHSERPVSSKAAGHHRGSILNLCAQTPSQALTWGSRGGTVTQAASGAHGCQTQVCGFGAGAAGQVPICPDWDLPPLQPADGRHLSCVDPAPARPTRNQIGLVRSAAPPC